ncbi:transcriptional regulator, LacI family [Geodermatophilus siccatus]|uniref:Transcriptional regulator, LacI family n=1 Tax=Geodermatophilus siccatus TaxID=1137991 RepID=A0A1G9Y9L0_9ACTN|nr:LacI family DNA-binding transcriptional regulator [Geodermatophilus siccatus]SDN05191.1 transcriptional regulator, LacI family [Geodermatophilus siccatus]
MGRKPTLRDVSVASGLSTYTVSRALSDGDGVSAASREAVLKAAREVGYVPNAAAQQLRKNTRSSVAVITASTSNHYYLELMRGIDRTLRRSGRTTVVADIAAEGRYTTALEDATVQHLIQSRAAGVISTLTLRGSNLDLLHDWDIPVVFVDAAPPEEAGLVPSITTDNRSASQAVGDHLAEHGYGQWLLLAYPSRWSTRVPREAGLRETARRHGAELTVVESENDVDSAVRALEAHLDRSGPAPRALVAGNNPLLQGALRVLRSRGLRVPDDVAVIAFDEFPWAPLLDPPLTVLDEHSETIGELAAQTLTRLIDAQIEAERAGRPVTPAYLPDDRREVAFDLVVRKSCGC